MFINIIKALAKLGSAFLPLILFSNLVLALPPVETESSRLLFDGYETNGLSYDVDVDGDTAIVGGGPPGTEGARIFTRNNDIWNQQAILAPSDGWNGSFATTVSISGDTAIVGLGGWWTWDKQLPHFYVFVRTNGVWTEQAKLPTPPEVTDLIAPSVAIDGDTAVLGFADSSSNSAIVIYHRTSGTWAPQAKFLCTDCSGWDIPVAISNNKVAFRAEGQIKIYQYNGAAWDLQDYFPFAPISSGSIALFNNTLAFTLNDGGTNNNNIHVYRNTSGQYWEFEARLSSSEGLPYLGYVLGMHENSIIASTGGIGSILFSRTGNSWSETKKLIPSDLNGQLFGWANAISSDTIVIGALGAAPYVYDYTGNSSDQDNDGILDVSDNCPTISNPGQEDNDLDGAGDVCDEDDDNDNVPDSYDNCHFNPNPDQLDSDQDGRGDICDDDLDGDTILNALDNCPSHPNPFQGDVDFDGLGDVCDPDDDNDGVADDLPDNCPLTPNPDQSDLDGDGVGDLCDADKDGDGIINPSDNCPLDTNPGQDDTDQDGSGDVCDEDDDADLIPDTNDNCPLIFNSDQQDTDGDGQGDACDGDLDGDGVDNETDNCPITPNSNQSDLDGDGAGDNCDADIDGDRVTNEEDQCPATPLDDQVDPIIGCSIDQLCPCTSPRGSTESWRNHGRYVSCITQTAKNFRVQGLITDDDHGMIVSIAAESECGK